MIHKVYPSEYRSWSAMRWRCSPNNKEMFRYYAGRGIKVCKRWDSFDNFIEDMGTKPSKEYTIDRKDNDGNYQPGNCRWATRTEQALNRRVHTVNESGIVGVIKHIDRWHSYIKIAGHKVFIGSFRSKDDAIAARKAAETKRDRLYDK